MDLELFAITIVAVFAIVILAFLWTLLFDIFAKLKQRGIFIRLGMATIIISYIVVIIIRFIDGDFDGIGHIFAVLVGLIITYIGIVKKLKGDYNGK